MDLDYWLNFIKELIMNDLNTIDSGLSFYVKSIKNFPILEADEEYKLAKEYQETHNKRIAHKLIQSHLRLVIKLARQFYGYGLPLDELISEGNLGLLYAVEKFEPDKGFRFSTYAIWWIKAFIQKYILNSWSLVKLGTTSAQKKLFFNLKKIKNQMNLHDDSMLNDDLLKDIAEKLNISIDEVIDMNNRIDARDTSLNVKIGDEDCELGDFIADSKENPETECINLELNKKRRISFREHFENLNPREKNILFKRRLSDKVETLDELSKQYNISKERVRQIELNSIHKIQKNITLM